METKACDVTVPPNDTKSKVITLPDRSKKSQTQHDSIGFVDKKFTGGPFVVALAENGDRAGEMCQ